jgi:predicted nucleotidyltransferase
MAIAIDIPKERLREFCRKWKVTEFALFGSAVRPEEFNGDSDVDVLIRLQQDAPWSLASWLDMKEELVAIFGRDVDLVEREGVESMRNYLRRAAILDTAVPIDVA